MLCVISLSLSDAYFPLYPLPTLLPQEVVMEKKKLQGMRTFITRQSLRHTNTTHIPNSVKSTRMSVQRRRSTIRGRISAAPKHGRGERRRPQARGHREEACGCKALPSRGSSSRWGRRAAMPPLPWLIAQPQPRHQGLLDRHSEQIPAERHLRLTLP
jgi:hypothetical protein